jgi:hypothetical protein
LTLNKRRTEKKDENCHGWREGEGHAKARIKNGYYSKSLFEDPFLGNLLR